METGDPISHKPDNYFNLLPNPDKELPTLM
jgi:hypothetical protein